MGDEEFDQLSRVDQVSSVGAFSTTDLARVLLRRDYAGLARTGQIQKAKVKA